MSQSSSKLSVVIPAYNEAKRLPATLREVLAWLDTKKRPAEVVIVDDGSTDDTLKVAEALAKADQRINLVGYKPNAGKGAAVRRGVTEARGNLILIMDADNATPISELPKLEAALKHSDIAIGSRYLGQAEEPDRNLLRMALSRLGNWLIRQLLVPGINDTQCGFKLFKAEIAKPIFARAKVDRWGFDFEILALARRKGYKITEVPVNWHEAAGSHLRASRAAWPTFVELGKTWWRLRKS